MMMTGSLRDVAANSRRLAGNGSYSAQIRDMASEVLDLSELMETWPVPPSLKLDEELKHKVSALCRRSRIALCGSSQHHCGSAQGTASVFCRIQIAHRFLLAQNH